MRLEKVELAGDKDSGISCERFRENRFDRNASGSDAEMKLLRGAAINIGELLA